MFLDIILKLEIRIKTKFQKNGSQTNLSNAERYITEELKEYETKILGAEEKIAELEQEYFLNYSIYSQFVRNCKKMHKLLQKLTVYCLFRF